MNLSKYPIQIFHSGLFPTARSLPYYPRRTRTVSEEHFTEYRWLVDWIYIERLPALSFILRYTAHLKTNISLLQPCDLKCIIRKLVAKKSIRYIRRNLFLIMYYETYRSPVNMVYRIICQLRYIWKIIVHDCLAQSLSYCKYNNVQV